MALSTIPREKTEAPDGAVFTDIVALIDIDKLIVAPNVRESIGDIEDLAESIRQHGVLQPVSVRASGTHWILVFGQRRLAAAKAAGLTQIPAIIEPEGVPERDTAVRQLVENLQRQDLGPLEEARAFRAILDADKKLTQAELAKRIGRSAPYVSNALRILDTPPAVQAFVESGQLTGAHVKAIASLPAEDQVRLAEAAVSNDYPAHQTERDAKYVRERQADLAKRVKASASAGERAVTALAAAKIDKGTPVHLFTPWNISDEVVAKAVTEAGYALTNYVSWGARWDKCDCLAVSVHVQDGKGSTVEPACINVEHQQARVAEDDARQAAQREEQERDAQALRDAIGAAIKAQPPHPTIARLLLRSMDGYSGATWSEYAKRSDGDTIDELAKRVSIRIGSTYGVAIPFKKVIAALTGKPADKPAKAKKAGK